MTTTIDNLAQLSEFKAPADQFFVSIDIATWLGTDTISSCAFTAVDENDVDATATVLDGAKCTYSGTLLKPYIKGGANGVLYVAAIEVSTTAGDKKTWFVQFTCLTRPPR